MKSYYEGLLKALKDAPLERRTVFSSGQESIYKDGSPIIGDPMDTPDLTEQIVTEPHLVLFGCGHVGKALYDLAVLQDMKVTVLDSRPELLTEERFPKATRIVGEYSDLLSGDLGFRLPYYCIFTHGHTHDEECLLYALRHSHSYIGMIGSKAKVERCLNSISKKNITPEMLERLHSPIGLSINAVTPQEIAISIMAQIIEVFRADKKAVTIDPNVIAKASEEEGVMVRIVEKTGSAPRSVGSMMYVTGDSITGTIGGGAIESHAIDTARRMLTEGRDSLLEHHELTETQSLGMVCGGGNSLLYKRNG